MTRLFALCAVIAASFPAVSPAEIIGDYNREPVINYGADSDIGRLGLSVGRLDLLTDAGTGFCTAFLVEGNLLLAADYCVPGPIGDDGTVTKKVQKVNFVAGYWHQGSSEGTTTFEVNPIPL